MTITQPPSTQEEAEYIQKFRTTRSAYMEVVATVRDLHAKVGNSEATKEAQQEYDRLLRGDDKLLARLEALSAP